MVGLQDSLVESRWEDPQDYFVKLSFLSLAKQTNWHDRIYKSQLAKVILRVRGIVEIDKEKFLWHGLTSTTTKKEISVAQQR